jgi:glutathione S-transferase
MFEYDQVATDLNRPPVTVPFPAVTDIVNHAESLCGDQFTAPDIARALSGRLSFGGVALGAAKAQAHKRVRGRAKAVRS